MARNLEELLHFLRLERSTAESYSGASPHSSAGRHFGGLVAAQALLAAGASVPDGRRPCSIHSYFLAGGRPSAPIDYDVEATRDGGSISTRRVTASQDGGMIFDMASLFKLSEHGFSHQDSRPKVPDPDDLPRAERLPNGNDATEWGAVDIRFVGAWSRSEGSTDTMHTAHQRVWFRVDGRLPDDDLLHASALVFASDLTLLPVVVVPHRVGGEIPDIALRTSLDHSVWFHRPFRTDEWLLYDQVTSNASDGRGLALARIFSMRGQMVASANQEALIRRAAAPSSSNPAAEPAEVSVPDDRGER